ncbi:MAG: hypothetical protein WDZ61_00385 [Parcubacteria group bacterium]
MRRMQPDPLNPDQPVAPSAPKPSPEPAPEPTPEAEQYSELKQIRTFQGDVASTIGKQKESLVSIQRREQARRAEKAPSIEEMETSEDKKDTWKTVLLSLGTFLLIAGGIYGSWYAYTEYQEKTELPVITVPANRLITSTKTVEIAPTGLTRANLIEQIAEEGRSALSGQVTHLNVGQTTREFLETLEVRAPGRLLRALDDTFMLGVLGGEGNVFLIVKLASYESAFAGMLEWERSMAEDLGPIFSTRLALRDLESEPIFQDVVNRNKDSRVLRMALPLVGEMSTTTSTTTPVTTEDPGEQVATSTDSGVELGAPETVLVYSFFDQNTLIITDSDEALASILNKLSSELLSR